MTRSFLMSMRVFFIPVFAQDIDEEAIRDVAQSIAVARPWTSSGVQSRSGLQETRHYVRVNNMTGSNGEFVAPMDGGCRILLALSAPCPRAGIPDALEDTFDGQGQHMRISSTRYWEIRGTFLAIRGVLAQVIHCSSPCQRTTS